MSLFNLVFITGLVILLVAILLNIIASYLNIETWYSFLMKVQEMGLSKTVSLYYYHLFFLLIIYPLCLGASAYYIISLLKK